MLHIFNNHMKNLDFLSKVQMKRTVCAFEFSIIV